MPQSTSSSKRLYSILKQAQEQDEKTVTKDFWATVLGANPDNPNDISGKLGQLFELFNDVKDDIRGLESDSIEKYLRAVNRIQTTLMSNTLLSGNEWSRIKGSIAEETLDLIAACGDLMESQAKGVNEITPEELEDLRQEIDKLVSEILQSGIDKNTISFLLRRLREIEQAIINYQVRGSTGLDKTSSQAFGKILLRWPFSDKAKEKAGEVINLVLKANAMAGVYERMHQISEAVQKFLGEQNLLTPGNS